MKFTGEVGEGAITNGVPNFRKVIGLLKFISCNLPLLYLFSYQ